MRALVQRVSEASVKIDGEIVGEIGHGMLILVCAMDGDTDEKPAKLAAKLSKMRIFKDEDGKMNKSLVDVGGSALIVSQFTLSADTSRGNRPGFSTAARPDEGRGCGRGRDVDSDGRLWTAAWTEPNSWAGQQDGDASLGVIRAFNGDLGTWSRVLDPAP